MPQCQVPIDSICYWSVLLLYLEVNSTKNLFGRKIIYTATPVITEKNVKEELHKAMNVHISNQADIRYLYQYFKGDQPILERNKTVRPEINNKIVENHAQEIVNFKTGYLLGEPCSYVRRGEDNSVSDKIRQLNEFMFAEDKASHDRELAQWMHICGLGIRMALPDKVGEEDESPVEIDTLDPRWAFVVYHSGFGKKPVMGVKYILDDNGKPLFSVYTPTEYFEIRNNCIEQSKPNPLGMIPIFEYALNPERMGAFEMVLPLLDAINNVASNRLDGIEQFIQAIMVFENCDITEELFNELKEQGAIKVKSDPGNPGKVYYLVEQLDQSQTQTFVDSMYERVLEICGMPSTTKGGSSTSDTGQAVILRDGWRQAESMASAAEDMFKRAEKQFLKLVLRICRDSVGLDLKLADVSIKFSRRNTDNLLTKTQALLHMLEAHISPGVAIATCGLWSDPVDVTAQSEQYLKTWGTAEAERNGQGEETLNGANATGENPNTKTQKENKK